MSRAAIETYPGSEIVAAGLDDIAANRETLNSAAVEMAATRLRNAGFDVPGGEPRPLPGHRLYALLSAEDPDSAHSRYNSIVRRVISFARAAEGERAR